MVTKMLRRSLKKCVNLISHSMSENYSYTDKALLLSAELAARRNRKIETIEKLQDIEFSVFSQWGEDGIIDWLIERLGYETPETFIEFGVENYREANTRFLLAYRNWRGLVIDGGRENIDYIKSDNITWRHDLSTKCAFITVENIDKIIGEAGFIGDVGLLSIDIDGNDFWVWKAISIIQPHLVVIEYNSVFGDIHSFTIPYDPNFVRTRAHWSNLYFGASIQALCQLAHEKGYSLVGTNSAGNNAFFVRNDRANALLPHIRVINPEPSRFREARDQRGNLSFVGREARASVIADCVVFELSTATTEKLSSFSPIYSDRWLATIQGKIL